MEVGIKVMSEGINGAQSIKRAAMLLREIGNAHADGIRLVDLAERASLERPTTHRILKSLVVEGLVSQDCRNKRYFLGQGIVSLGFSITRKFDFRELARPLLEELAQETGDTFYLNLRIGNEALCLIRTDGICPVQNFSITPGLRRPLGVGAGGLAILAAMDPSEQELVMKANQQVLPKHKGLTKRALGDLVARTRSQGYSLMDVKGIAGIQAIGVAIINQRVGPVAALSVASIPGRFSSERREHLLDLLRGGARRLEALGADYHW